MCQQSDHIKPVASGGTNNTADLQAICRECHFGKTQEEQENREYVEIYDTRSSYNTQVLDIINSSANLATSCAETFVKHNNNDDKSQKHAMHYSQVNYPRFTVVGQVELATQT